jgi:hypothetical protein
MQYYEQHPDEKVGASTPGEMVFRYRTTETFLASGTPLSVCDVFRPLLERAGFSLPGSEHLGVYIPKIEDAEDKLLNSELEGEYISASFDGTTRLGEALNITGRWCTRQFHLRLRLLDFTTLAKHVDNRALATHCCDVLQRRRSIPATHIVGLPRDSAAVNGAACRRMLMVFTSAADILCICHTLCHVGERFELTTLDEFMTPWLELVGGRSPHHGAKMLWKETVAPATVPGYSNVRWYSKAEIEFIIGEAGTRRLRDFLFELDTRGYGEATTAKMINIYNTKGDMLRLELAAMLDMRELVRITYMLEGDRLEILLIFDLVETLRALGRSLQAKADGILPNVDGVIRRLMELKKGVTIEKYFDGHGVWTGTLDKKETVDSTLYQGEEREAWLVKYPDGHSEHFEEEELRSGKDGPHPQGKDGKPVLVVRGRPERNRIYDALVPGFEYLEARITGTCDAQYSCVNMYELCRYARAFNPNFAAAHVTPAFVDMMTVITPLNALGLLPDLKRELPAFLAAAANAPAFDKSDVQDFTTNILTWWREHGSGFPKWAEAARIVFALSPNSASCERVFSLLKCMFTEQQMAALGDYIRAALMLNYNKRTVG